VQDPFPIQFPVILNRVGGDCGPPFDPWEPRSTSWWDLQMHSFIDLRFYYNYKVLSNQRSTPILMLGDI
jgi:hypothetical protein